MAGIKICKRNNCNANPVIGDTGPAGGIIYFIMTNGFDVPGFSGGSGETEHLNFDGYRANYIEVAPENIETTLIWASRADLIPGLSQNENDSTDRAYGRGRLNTAIILARSLTHSTPYTAPAASACFSLTTGGKTDWYLPNSSELGGLARYQNEFGISVGWFWSSSQINTGQAWENLISSQNGSTLNANKSQLNNVRAVRAF
jgi:hypothetical protein